MKATILAFVASLVLVAHAQGSETVVSNENVTHLGQVSGSAISLQIPYPGSVICGVSFQPKASSSVSVEQFNQIIEVVTGFGPGGSPLAISQDLSIDLTSARGGFVAILTIRSKDGRPLSDVIQQALGSGADLVAVATPCH